MKLSKLVFVTSNKNKVREIKEILGPKTKFVNVDIPEIQSLNLEEVITAKAKSAYSILKRPVIVEDVSFEVDALRGLPGPFIKYFLQKLGTEGLLALIGNASKSTKAIAAVGFYDGNKLKIFTGIVEGTLSKKSIGESGFGFDRIFIPNGYTQTFAQMEITKKNKISHRANALRKLKRYLNK